MKKLVLFLLVLIAILHAKAQDYKLEKTIYGNIDQFSAGIFSSPSCIAVDDSLNIYLFDNGSYSVLKFDANGTFLFRWGSVGIEDTQFGFVDGIAVDKNFQVYVLENSMTRTYICASVIE